MSAVRVVGEIDPSFAWDGARLSEQGDLTAAGEPPAALRGSAAAVAPSANAERWRILRDPLGLGKLFWAREPDDAVAFSARPWLLVDRGHRLDEIVAVPRGLVLDLDPHDPERPAGSLIPEAWSAPPSRADADVEATGRAIRDQLDGYLAAIAARHPDAPAFVCLSGGLDSSGIAALVAERFAGAVAVSFDLRRHSRAASEDRQVAARVARDLGLPLLEATVTADELLDPLDAVLREGIDWRDFNVHAALVNAALAEAIAEADDGSKGRPLVFTGDLANEFLVDYHAERYRGRTYYSLPRLAPAALRSLLVRGLDTCNRELGIFSAWGLALIQPYAVAVDDYLKLPEPFLAQPDRKERLCRAIFGDLLPEYVRTRPKARAQVGGASSDEGVLAACVDRGLDAEALRRRFADLHGVGDGRSLDRFIRGGRYRARAPSGIGLERERG